MLDILVLLLFFILFGFFLFGKTHNHFLLFVSVSIFIPYCVYFNKNPSVSPHHLLHGGDEVHGDGAQDRPEGAASERRRSAHRRAAVSRRHARGEGHRNARARRPHKRLPDGAESAEASPVAEGFYVARRASARSLGSVAPRLGRAGVHGVLSAEGVGITSATVPIQGGRG